MCPDEEAQKQADFKRMYASLRKVIDDEAELRIERDGKEHADAILVQLCGEVAYGAAAKMAVVGFRQNALSREAAHEIALRAAEGFRLAFAEAAEQLSVNPN